MQGMSSEALKHNLDKLMRNGRHYTLDEILSLSGAYKYMKCSTLQKRMSQEFKDIYYHARDSDNIVRYRSYNREPDISVPSLTDLYKPAMQRLRKAKEKCTWLK